MIAEGPPLKSNCKEGWFKSNKWLISILVLIGGIFVFSVCAFWFVWHFLLGFEIPKVFGIPRVWLDIPAAPFFAIFFLMLIVEVLLEISNKKDELGFVITGCIILLASIVVSILYSIAAGLAVFIAFIILVFLLMMIGWVVGAFVTTMTGSLLPLVCVDEEDGNETS